MCGIYGMVSLSGDPLEHRGSLDRMSALLRHRGPDASGSVERDGHALGAQRLSIIDPRPQANQPFLHTTRDAWLVCNGEIYNAPALRRRFGRHPFRSRCDVESLVPLLADDGPSGLDSVEGMFALAWWEPRERTLLLARDRAGEKPLFYTVQDGELWFASEIQALLIHPRVTRDLDDLAVTEYLTLGYVREPRTLFHQIRRVPAGVCLAFHDTNSPTASAISLPRVTVPDSFSAAEHVLGQLLENAVAKQMTADVPVGVLTSGGVDSTLITALATRAAPGRLHSFTAAFEDLRFDESRPAARVSQHFGTTHRAVIIGEEDLAKALRIMVRGTAEPLADPAALPTYLVSRVAKEHVGVVLTGEGADELFGGYPTYLGHKIAPLFAALPRWCRSVVGTISARLATTHHPNALPFLLQRFAEHAEAGWRDRHLAWFGTGLLPYLDHTRIERLCAALPVVDDTDAIAGARRLDYRTYLRDGLLVKLDRAGMQASLETRCPFLDPAVTGFAASLPTAFVVRGLETKRILKAVAATRIPPWVVGRRKRGLSVPIATWINRGLRPEVDRLLDRATLSRRGVLPELPITQLLEEHRRGTANHARTLWPLIVLLNWLEHWGGE